MTQTQKSSRTWHIVLWIIQGLLAATLVWAGSMKLFQSPQELAAMWPWTAENPGLVKLTGVLDMLAALGLVLPALLRILPQLTIYTAWATLALMVAASVFHISRGEGGQIGINIFFAVMAVLVAWGRMKKAPISSK